MTDLLARRLTPSDMTVDSRVGDETVLLHLDSGMYFGLDPLGTRIWERIKGGEAGDAICAALAVEYAAPLETIHADARAFLADLVSNGILTEH